MLRNKTEIKCDNCGHVIEEPVDVHKLTYFGKRNNTSKIVRAMICETCADEFERHFVALFHKH